MSLAKRGFETLKETYISLMARKEKTKPIQMAYTKPCLVIYDRQKKPCFVMEAKEILSKKFGRYLLLYRAFDFEIHKV